ncbi:unnamed protein product [Microthlaspi erraticum]|uniref:KIB1-4 beta-propeller domain-containing protein n=1 Tax=Microthlaspi erraticum TaxID=1685480 RepID=A0A6D2IJ17_9BRAS|nr:unnamed protein product [Microthlaspi erraticum]
MKKTRKFGRWSELPMDMLRSVLELLTIRDFHRTKIACWNWYLCSKQILRPKYGSPLLMLSTEEGRCHMYSPGEDRVYETKSDFSGYRFLGSSGRWFLAADSRSQLSIIDVFSDERIDLPPVESIKGDLRGVLWVDEKNGDYVVVWQFGSHEFLGFCKKGDDHYREITTHIGVPVDLKGVYDMVLKGYSLYVLTVHKYIRHLDLSGQDGFKDVSENQRFPVKTRDLFSENIVVKTSGEVLCVRSKVHETSSFTRRRTFHVYNTYPEDRDPGTYYYDGDIELKSLRGEALFLDLGIPVKVAPDHSLGIEPNSIYFSRGDRYCHKKVSCLDMCVYNLATKTSKPFPGLSNLKVKDALWFLPR